MRGSCLREEDELYFCRLGYDSGQKGNSNSGASSSQYCEIMNTFDKFVRGSVYDTFLCVFREKTEVQRSVFTFWYLTWNGFHSHRHLCHLSFPDVSFRYYTFKWPNRKSFQRNAYLTRLNLNIRTTFNTVLWAWTQRSLLLDSLEETLKA